VEHCPCRTLSVWSTVLVEHCPCGAPSLWTTVLLEKPAPLRLVKKYPHFVEPEGSLPCSQGPPFIRILSQNKPLTVPNLFLEDPLNIFLLSVLNSSKRTLSLRFFQQNPLCTFPLHHTCHMPRPSDPSFNQPNNTC